MKKKPETSSSACKQPQGDTAALSSRRGEGREEVLLRIKHHFERAGASYNAHALMQRSVAAHLSKLAVEPLTSPPQRMLEVGCGTGMLTHQLLKQLEPPHYYLNDLASGVCGKLKEEVERCYPAVRFHLLLGDAETQVPFPTNMDMIASASTVQWFERLDCFFDKVAAALNPHTGLLAFNTFGPENYREIRTLTGQGLHYPSTVEVERMLRLRFGEVKQQEVVTEQLFDSPTEVLHHIRHTGVSLATDFCWTPSRLREFDTQYRARYSQNGKVTLRWHTLYYVARIKSAIKSVYLPTN